MATNEVRFVTVEGLEAPIPAVLINDTPELTRAANILGATRFFNTRYDNLNARSRNYGGGTYTAYEESAVRQRRLRAHAGLTTEIMTQAIERAIPIEINGETKYIHGLVANYGMAGVFAFDRSYGQRTWGDLYWPVHDAIAEQLFGGMNYDLWAHPRPI